ncbi:hypothetical protein JW979_02960, partial [bacterium]|nr:hypothetical protein [candidate division CSSED10-310 bacterium]
HIAAHIDAIENKILPCLKRGTSVILDRYWWSTWVYGMVDGACPSSLDRMIEIEKSHWSETFPTALFLITGKNPHRIETPSNRWISLNDKYLEIARKEKDRYPVHQITNNGNVENAAIEVTNAASLYLRKSGNSDSYPPLNLYMQLSPIKTTEVFESYWRFATERQNIFFKRFSGELPPWSSDPILQEFKFTNAYRASDRVSQYLIRHVIYEGEQSADEIFFRTILFKIFNRVETWELLESKLGEISFSTYNFKRYNEILDEAMRAGNRIYSAAYIMPTGGGKYARKHSMHLQLLEKMMAEGLPDRIANCKKMALAFEALREYPTIGDFLAYQFVTDLNYSTLTGFSEMEFVVPGPGAKDGIRKCFKSLGGLSEAEIVKVVAEKQEEAFEYFGCEFKTLWGRKLQLIDCQNLFCEIDKYARKKFPEIEGRSKRSRIKQKYKIHQEKLEFWYPPKWGLNDLVSSNANPDVVRSS